jgi:flagellar biosynthesis chaperone FliJ
MNDQVLISKLATIVNKEEKELGLSLSKAIQQLDKFLEEPTRKLDGKLTHYLEKRSYVKAYEFLKNAQE